MTATAAELLRIEINGASATADQLRAAAFGSFGHFTAMQVRARRARGLQHHVARLDAANRELFGVGIDEQVVRPPGGMLPGPWRLRAVPYQRPVAHIKHTADFGQRYYQRLAHASGFDEALLTGQDAIISEGSITNVGCFDGRQVIWPAAPALSGITMQLIEPALAGRGLPSARAHIRVRDLGSFAGVFVSNARGIAPVGQVDDLRLPIDQDLMERLGQTYESLPWDSI